MAEDVRLTVYTNKNTFPVKGQEQLAYILMEAVPIGEAANVQMPLNFAFVLDHSGSMDGQKIENLKDATQLAIDQLTPQDLVTIVAFDDTVDVVVENQPASNTNSLKRAVDKIQAAGGTKISRGMEAGLTELQKGAQAGRVQRMLLLTDGRTHGDEKQCHALAAQAGQQGIAINTFGLGTDWKEDLLDDIADNSGGIPDFIRDGEPEAILSTFEHEVRSAQGTVVQNANLILRLVAGVMPRAVWRVTPMISKLGHRAISESDVQVDLGDMEREQGQSILVELMIPPRRPGTYRLAQAEISYDVLALKRTNEKVQADILLRFTEDPTLAAQSNPYVLNIVEKVTAHKLQTRALSEAEVGNVAGATQKLRAAATRLLSLGEKELADTALEEADRLEKGEHLSSAGTKKLRYETRKLTQD
jgi:Ca-activated chloride channel family protein